eukprot:scaffold194120_cov37-Prasinocladus_malaysianus.AAC.1
MKSVRFLRVIKMGRRGAVANLRGNKEQRMMTGGFACTPRMRRGPGECRRGPRGRSLIPR